MTELERQLTRASQQDIEDRLNGLASDYEQLAADYKLIVDGLGRR